MEPERRDLNSPIIEARPKHLMHLRITRLNPPLN
jgi:hypothetical protein